MESRVFNNEFGNIRIEYILDKLSKNVIMIDIQYNDKYIKLFLLTLRDSIDTLIDENYKGFIQYVPKEDWENYLKKDKNWIFLSEDDNICKIYCNIDKAIECISRGLGIFECSTNYETII